MRALIGLIVERCLFLFETPFPSANRSANARYLNSWALAFKVYGLKVSLGFRGSGHRLQSFVRLPELNSCYDAFS